MTASLTWSQTIGWGMVVASGPDAVARPAIDPDAALVARCLTGDETAWESLVRLHTRRVYAICYRFAGRAEQADRKSTRLNSSHIQKSRMPSSA